MLVFLIFGIFFHLTTAQFECQDFLESPVRYIIIYESTDDVIDTLYISDIEGVRVEDSAYITASVDNKYLIIKKVAGLEEFVKNENYVAKVTLDCEDGEYSLEYNINVRQCDGVEFRDALFKLQFYGFIEKGDAINLLTSDRIEFECGVGTEKFNIEENEYFRMDDDESGTIIALKDIIPPPTFNKTFTIMGWDDTVAKTNPAITSLQIVVNMVYETRIDFTDKSYYGYIDSDLYIVIKNGPIALETDVDINDIYIVVSSEYSNFFGVQYSENEIILVSTDEAGLADLESDTITLTLTAYDVRNLDSSADAVVTLDLTYLKGKDSPSLQQTSTLSDEAHESFEDNNKDEILIQEQTEMGVHSPLTQFNVWVSNTISLSIMLMIVCGLTILSAILFLRARNSRRVMY